MSTSSFHPVRALHGRARPLAVALAAFAMSCAPGAYCENREVERVLPPSGDRVAVVFSRSCGATTGVSTHLSLIAEGPMPESAGNVLSVDTDHGAAPSDSIGGPVVRASWRGSDTLVVRHHPKARVFRAESRVHGITVVFAQDSLP
jgi:hypothetical protein